MPYEFSPQETVAQSLLRCAREQLDRAVQALRDEIHEDPVTAIHTARKALKKERALLRLARASLSPQQRATENVRLRDAARMLSGLRDADVMVQAVEQLASRFSGQVPAATFAAVRDQLLDSRAAQRALTPDGELPPAVIQQLMGARLRVDEWGLRADGWKAIQSGLRRTYRRGRNALGRARRDPSVEHLHEWRKRVKDHWYHLRLLAPVCGPVVAGAAQEAARLSEVLGEDHDLAVLREVLAGHWAELGVQTDALMGLIDHRREQLQAEAVQIGLRLYAERPKAFERRLRRCWKAGRMPRNSRPEIA